MHRDFLAFWNYKMFRVSIYGMLIYSLTGPLFNGINFTVLWMAVQALIIVRLTVITVFRLEIRNGTEKFFASLPVWRRDLVLARYFEVTAVAVFFMAIGYLSNSIIRLFGRPDLTVPFGCYATVSIIVILIASFSLPFFFTMGSMKVHFMSYLAVVAVLYLGVLHDLLGYRGNLDIFFNYLTTTDLLRTTVIVGITVFILAVSTVVSISWYSKKDL